MPSFDGSDSVLLATGILGATVMPHVIYLHSALTQRRIKLENDAAALMPRFSRCSATRSNESIVTLSNRDSLSPTRIRSFADSARDSGSLKVVRSTRASGSDWRMR